MEAVMCEGEAGTGIFGLRLMMENVGELSDRLGTLHPGIASDAARFEKAIGKTLYIHLSRKDMVAQAVSLAKAMQTGLWHIAPDGAELERMAPPQTPKYDANLIKQNIAAFVRFDEDWNRWFDQQGINPVRVSYEALSDNPPAVLKDILEHLGLNPTLASGIMPGVAKLADTQSAEWIRRYRSESNYSGPR
jgi:LPS sulfotransferase NodH